MTDRFLAALALIIAVIAILLVVSIKEHAPLPTVPLVNSSALVVKPVHPPQFCREPMPIASTAAARKGDR